MKSINLIEEPQVIRNNGKPVFFVEELADGKNFRLKFDGAESYILIKLGLYGNNAVEVTSDFRVLVSGYRMSDPHEPEDLRIRLAEVGLRLEIVTAEEERKSVQPLRNDRGELTTNVDSIMAMAGHGPEARQWETTDNGLVYLLCLGRRHPEVPPRLAREVRHEAHLIIAASRQWIHANLRSFKRHVQLSDWEAVQLWKAANHTQIEIIRVKVGETIMVETSDGSYFGSGGGWGNHQEWGKFTRQWIETQDTGFITFPKHSYTFDQGPAVVYTAAGDSINGSRLSWRKMYIAE